MCTSNQKIWWWQRHYLIIGDHRRQTVRKGDLPLHLVELCFQEGGVLFLCYLNQKVLGKSLRMWSLKSDSINFIKLLSCHTGVKPIRISITKSLESSANHTPSTWLPTINQGHSWRALQRLWKVNWYGNHKLYKEVQNVQP